jgi:hypothetical protein
MSEISRRSLLRAGVVVAAVVPVSGLVLPTGAAFAGTAVTRSSFTPHLGSAFTLPGGSRLKLTAIEDLPNAVAGDPRRFSLTFRLDTGPKPEQGTWKVTHRKLGRLSMFLVPVGRRGDLQAVFNAR